MGLFDRFKRQSKPDAVACRQAPGVVCAPVSGRAVALTEAPDPVFAEGVLGAGIVIKPTGDTVYAPFDGIASAVIGSGHAIGLVDGDGCEVLIHVGVDTVEMKGDGFEMFVGQGDAVKGGEALIRFDRAKVRKAGHPDDIIVFISNTAEYASVEPIEPQPVEAGQPLIRVRR